VFSTVVLGEVVFHPGDHFHTFADHILAIVVVSFSGGIVAAGGDTSSVLAKSRLVGLAAPTSTSPIRRRNCHGFVRRG